MHRHGASAVSTDPSLVTERFFESFTETDTDILNRVVGIYLQVAFCVELQIEKTVASDLGQHMIEERHSGFNLVLPATIQLEGQLDAGLFGTTINRSGPCHGFLHQKLNDLLLPLLQQTITLVIFTTKDTKNAKKTYYG